MKPNIRGIRGIKSHHCFQFIDVNYVDCCVMCGDAWDVSHVRFTSGPQTRSSSFLACDQDDANDDDDDVDVTLNKCTHMDDDAQLELDVNDDDEDDDEDDPQKQASSPSSLDAIAVRVSKRQRTSRSTFTSVKGDDYFDIDDLDLG